MATDATGTPTALGIRKYNVDADAPSGLGFNGAMDDIDALLTARIPKSLVTTTGDLIYASGVSTPARLPIGTSGQVLTVSGGIPAWGAGGGTAATTLPGSPTNGQQAVLTDSTSAPTYYWLMQYNSTLGKWLFLGGSPGFAEVATSETTASAAYAALATAGPSFALPVAGAYDITVGVLSAQNSSAGSQNWMSYDIGGTGAADADSVSYLEGTGTSGGNISRPRRKTGLTAVTLTAKYRVSAGTGTFASRFISVVPYQL